MKSLFQEDLIGLGKKAFKIKRELYGDKVYYVKNIQLNYSNICVNGCKFCAFSKKKGKMALMNFPFRML